MASDVAKDHQRGDAKDPLLELIIQKYTQAARDSIRGPVALKADMHFLARNSPSFRSVEFKKPDPLDEHKARETSLDGYTVASFNVGGEKRLCFTQLVQVVLKDCNVQEIFKRRDELLIFCSKCSPQQLDALKLAGVLPWTTTSSNLISKSDAYRLCGSLYGSRAVKGDPMKRSPVSFEVYHECFGGCIGVFDPELYHDANATCIRCTDCSGLFSTRKFVSHNHMAYDEVHTCHWGFDSSRWRSYLMLVEQKPNRDLVTLWASVKAKFDVNRSKQKPSTADSNQDFFSYVGLPEQKKSLVSPIENLRRRESRSLTGEFSRTTDYFDGRSEEREPKDRSSAFYPWSLNQNRPAAGSRYSEGTHFRFPDSSPSVSKASLYSSSMHPAAVSSCGCGPGLPSSSMYMDCQQCKSAAHVQSCSGLHMLAQKASELPVELDVKPGLESVILSASCSCDQCNVPQRDSISSCIEEVLRRFARDIKTTNATSELVNVLSSEMKRMGISQEDKIHELTVGNQRLQTELHLMKTEYQKKLSEALETKAHLEQELELVQRERQKDISRYNQMTWEFSQQVEKQKVSTGEQTEMQKETLLKEIRVLKLQLEQSLIDRENLHKQLSWQLSKAHKKSELASKMEVDKWTPFPTIGNKFSDTDSDSEVDERNSKLHGRTGVVYHTSRPSGLLPSLNTAHVPEALPSRASAGEPSDAKMDSDMPDRCVVVAAPFTSSRAKGSSPLDTTLPSVSPVSSKRKLAAVDRNDNRIETDEDVDIEVEE